MHKICMHHCEALNLLLLSYVIVHDQMHREVFDFLFKIWKSLWMFGWVFYPVVWNQQKEVDVRDCFMMLQPVSGWEIVTYWILFVGFSLVIIALSISTAGRLNIVRVFLFADEWMSQWSLDTVGFCFGLVHPVSFSFFCHEPSVLTKYLQCWFNTHSESCIKSLSHLSQVEAGSLDTYWGSTSDFSAKLLHCVKIFD